MRKSHGLLIVTVMGVLLAAVRWQAWAADRPRAEQPNIIWIMTDDQRWNTVPLLPTVQAEIAGHGFTFRNAFVTTPLCCPSRASFLTGQYAWKHDVLTNHAPLGGATRLDDTTTLATLLQDGGYRTALLGKYLNDYDALIDEKGYPYVPPGWDEWLAFVASTTPGESFYYNYTLNDNGTLVMRGSDPADYSSDLLTERAVAFIEDAADQPFFLFLSYWAPHTAPIPAARHAGQFDNWTPPLPPSFNEADMTDKPAYMQAFPPVNPQETLSLLRDQMETLLAVDDGVAAVLAALEAGGTLNKTYIFYVSDNGYAYGEHRWVSKRVPYDESIRVPLLLRVPFNITPQVRDELVLNIDIMPTVLQLARVPVPPPVMNGLDGRSLRTIGQPGWRTDFVIEKLASAPEELLTLNYIGLRSAEWKYVRYDTGELELYDLQADPFEMTNRAYDPAYAATVAALEERLSALRPGWPEGSAE